MAPLIPERHSTPNIEDVPELPSTEWGSHGFSSTGRNQLTVAADQPLTNQIETNLHKHTLILKFVGILPSLNVALRVICDAVRAKLPRWVIHCILKAFPVHILTQWVIHCVVMPPLDV